MTKLNLVCGFKLDTDSKGCSLPRGHEGQHNTMGVGTPGDPMFGVAEWTLVTVDVRVPRRNELYINKNGLVQRCKSWNWSRRAQPRPIVAEKWKLLMGLASSYVAPPSVVEGETDV